MMKKEGRRVQRSFAEVVSVGVGEGTEVETEDEVGS